MEDYRKYFATSASCSSLKNAAPLFYQNFLGFHWIFLQVDHSLGTPRRCTLMGLGRLGKKVIMSRCSEVFHASETSWKVSFSVGLWRSCLAQFVQHIPCPTQLAGSTLRAGLENGFLYSLLTFECMGFPIQFCIPQKKKVSKPNQNNNKKRTKRNAGQWRDGDFCWG